MNHQDKRSGAGGDPVAGACSGRGLVFGAFELSSVIEGQQAAQHLVSEWSVHGEVLGRPET